MTGIIANSVYKYLEVYNLIPVEQKGCKRNVRETKYQLLIDKMVMNDCKKRHTNLGIAWTDYKKTYDMIPHSWILEVLNWCKSNEGLQHRLYIMWRISGIH